MIAALFALVAGALVVLLFLVVDAFADERRSRDEFITLYKYYIRKRQELNKIDREEVKRWATKN